MCKIGGDILTKESGAAERPRRWIPALLQHYTAADAPTLASSTFSKCSAG